MKAISSTPGATSSSTEDPPAAHASIGNSQKTPRTETDSKTPAHEKKTSPKKQRSKSAKQNPKARHKKQKGPRKPNFTRKTKPNKHPLEKAFELIDNWVWHQLGPENEGLVTKQIPLNIEHIIKQPGKARLDQRARDFSQKLQNQIRSLEEQLVLEQCGYQEGHVYCHRCESALCEHSAVPDARSVCIGYNETGEPIYKDFSSWAIEIRDERLSQLFWVKPKEIAIFATGPELTRNILSVYKNANSPYRIVAQVSAGNFKLPLKDKSGSCDFAVSAQLIEHRFSGGEASYRLNLVHCLPQDHHFASLLSERICPHLSDFIASITSEVAKLNDKLSSARRQGQRYSIKQTRALASRCLEKGPVLLEKYVRKASRRTTHAQERSQDPSRPTAAALSDAQNAGAEDLFYDRHEDTVIVRGPKNRIHVFRDDGTLITSVVYSGESVRERLTRGRWIALDSHQVELLKEQLHQQKHGEEH